MSPRSTSPFSVCCKPRRPASAAALPGATCQIKTPSCTGNSRIDRGVCLNRTFDQTAIARSDGTLQSADNSGSERSIQTKWIADSQNLLAYLQFVRISQRYRSQWLAGRLNQLYYREIGVRIPADDLGGVVFLTAETHRELLRSFDDVVVRKNVTFLIENRT